MVLFPGVFMPVSVGRKSSLKLVREAEKKNSYIAVVCQKVAETETPLFEDLHTIGTVAKIVRVLEMPDQTTTVILQGSKRMELKEITDTTPYLKGRIATLNEELPEKNDKEFHALVEACKDLTARKSTMLSGPSWGFSLQRTLIPLRQSRPCPGKNRHHGMPGTPWLTESSFHYTGWFKEETDEIFVLNIPVLPLRPGALI